MNYKAQSRFSFNVFMAFCFIMASYVFIGEMTCSYASTFTNDNPQNEIVFHAIGKEATSIIGRTLNYDGTSTNHRTPLTFDISELPDNAKITSAFLYLTGNESGNSAEIFDINVVQNETVTGSLNSDEWQDGIVNAIELDIAKLSLISNTISLELVSSLEKAEYAPCLAEYVGLFSAGAATEVKPYLIVVYGYERRGNARVGVASGNLLQNPGAENGETSWNLNTEWWVYTGNLDGLNPHSGNSFFRFNYYSSSVSPFSQVIDVSTYASIIDAENAESQISIWTSTWNDAYLSKKFNLSVQYLDESGVTLEQLTSGYVTVASVSDVWKKTALTKIVPAGTRTMKLSIESEVLGSYISYYIAVDDASIQINSVASVGSLTVNLSPQNAITSGGQWNVDNGSWQNSGTTISDLSAGSHTVAFKDITGWTKPASQTVTITNGVTSTVTAAYTTTAIPPTATTLTPTSITSTTATLNGSVNPNGLATTYYFEYDNYPSPCNPFIEDGCSFVDKSVGRSLLTTNKSVGAGTTGITVMANITGLTEDAEYQYRIIATNSAGTTYGDYEIFNTLTQITDDYGDNCSSAQVVTLNSSLNGKIEVVGDNDYFKVILPSNGTLKVYKSENSSISGYLKNSACTDIDIYDHNGVDLSAGTYYIAIEGYQSYIGAYTFNVEFTGVSTSGSLNVTLLPSTAVTAGAQWQVDNGAWNKSGATVSGLNVGIHTVDFQDVAGWTKPASQTVTISNGQTATATGTYTSSGTTPTVTTGSAASIAATTATINGTVNPNGAATTYYFEYGLTTVYGKKTTTTSAGSGTTATSVNANLTGLTAKTTYNFRLVATNSAGTRIGNNQTFTTLDNTNPGTGPTLALSSGSGAPGQPVTVNLTLTNVAGSAVSAISTDIAFDSNVLETPSAVIGAAGLSAGKAITTRAVGTNVFRVGVLSMENNNAIGNGVVASVTFKIKSTATNGATTQLTQTSSGSNQSAGEIAITGTAGTISVANSCGLGDCNCDGKVSISEVQAAVNMYLGINSVQSCCDRDGNGSISISEVQAVINNYLGIVSAANAISEDQDDYTERTVTRAGTPTLTLEGKTATAGSTVKLALTLANSSGAVASISTDISYDVNLFASVTAAIGPSGTSASKAITQRDLGGGVIRVGVLAMDNNNIISDGVVAYLTLTAKSTATGTASIKNTASGSNQNAQEIVITGNTAQVSFGSTATAPTATNSTTSLITSTTATLNGTVNPKGLATTYKFEYGKTTAYGQLTPAGDAGSGTTSKAVAANLTGLTANTTYNFRLVAWNSAGTTNAVNTTFTTAATTGTVTKPTVTTSAATLITSNSVKLAGTINPNSGVTTYYFEYGATTTYGAKTSSLNAGSGTTAISVKANMLGLTPNTTYHFRLVGTNSAGTTYGSDMVFSTALKPLVTTSSATSITSTSAILNGSVDPNGGVTDYYFEYGTTTSYGSITRDKRSKRVSTSVNESVTGLSKNTLYHFRLVAANSAGTTYGLDKIFTTLP